MKMTSRKGTEAQRVCPECGNLMVLANDPDDKICATCFMRKYSIAGILCASAPLREALPKAGNS